MLQKSFDKSPKYLVKVKLSSDMNKEFEAFRGKLINLIKEILEINLN